MKTMHPKARGLRTLVAFITACFMFNVVAVAATAKDEIIDKTNQIFEIIQGDINDLGKSSDTSTLHFINEYSSMRFAATVIAYQQESGIQFEDVLESLIDNRTLQVHSEKSSYLATVSSMTYVDFQSMSVYFPKVSMTPKLEGEILKIYYQLIDAYTHRSRLEADGLEIADGDKLVFPLHISWWRDCITSEYGDRDIEDINESIGGSLKSRNHTGLDIGVGEGTEVYSAAYGQVLSVTDSDSGLGLSITVYHGEYVTVYGHLSKVYVKEGDTVYLTTPIALTGNSGWSTGPHLHWEVYKNGVLQDPLKVIEA